MVQEKIADSYAPIRMLRLFVLETAWKIDNTSTQEARTDIAAVKYTMAKVLREVSFNALHILGSLGTTDLTPLQAMYAARADDGHRRRRRRGAQGHRRPQRAEGATGRTRAYWPTEYIPAKREAAWEKFEPKFEADPELRALGRGLQEVLRPQALTP